MNITSFSHEARLYPSLTASWKTSSHKCSLADEIRCAAHVITGFSVSKLSDHVDGTNAIPSLVPCSGTIGWSWLEYATSSKPKCFVETCRFSQRFRKELYSEREKIAEWLRHSTGMWENWVKVPVPGWFPVRAEFSSQITLTQADQGREPLSSATQGWSLCLSLWNLKSYHEMEVLHSGQAVVFGSRQCWRSAVWKHNIWWMWVEVVRDICRRRGCLGYLDSEFHFNIRVFLFFVFFMVS